MLGFVKSQKKRDFVISQNSCGFMVKKKKKKKKDNVTLWYNKFGFDNTHTHTHTHAHKQKTTTTKQY